MAKEQKDTKSSEISGADLSKDDQKDAGTEAETKTNPEVKNKTAQKQIIKVLNVVAKREGFRRAGRAFGSENTRLIMSELTNEQIAQLKAEHMLVVTEATEEV